MNSGRERLDDLESLSPEAHRAFSDRRQVRTRPRSRTRSNRFQSSEQEIIASIPADTGSDYYHGLHQTSTTYEQLHQSGARLVGRIAKFVSLSSARPSTAKTTATRFLVRPPTSQTSSPMNNRKGFISLIVPIILASSRSPLPTASFAFSTSKFKRRFLSAPPPALVSFQHPLTTSKTATPSTRGCERHRKHHRSHRFSSHVLAHLQAHQYRLHRPGPSTRLRPSRESLASQQEARPFILRSSGNILVSNGSAWTSSASGGVTGYSRVSPRPRPQRRPASPSRDSTPSRRRLLAPSSE